MRSPIRRALQVVAFLVVVVIVGVTFFPGTVFYWGSPLRIEHYLQDQTPIGSTQEAVVTWLRRRGSGAKINAAAIAPRSAFPPTQAGGASFIQTSIASYRIVLRTDVEAFYVFDAKARLADIGVRRTVDAP